ncbi:hypothetical protein TRIATDRAFT_263405 [Trichoderma atroviride IMI 206040]|uniref:Uncharacterized protein n=1 Tax=Hypocrea atroviridis (strain ATCC 20476 / IMI 206040) TaxID=452589 RepID=G9NQZ3_HYPAI|nr:uncharacterized protein TRIATDRAFT_263405 [Trichoderma atroviride IMI 206040]EHK46963.1 hypothetical protein TRIATDRAFT_263405 [Trichoderma atroviride IMI 206040]
MAPRDPIPTFILCPDFNIPPPPLGQLQLGSVLGDLGIQGVLNPINRGDEIQVSESSLVPADGPLEKAGFTRHLEDLHHGKSSIWARILNEDILGAKFFGKRTGNETLTRRIQKQTLESPTVSSFVDQLRHKKRIYLITGLIWTEGARLSKVQHQQGTISSELAVPEPLSSTSIGLEGSYSHGSTISCGFSSSSPFILGFRVKKIWWDRHGKWHEKERTAGCTLSYGSHRDGSVMDGIRYADDEVDSAEDQTFVDETLFGETDPITWIIRR